MNRQALKFTNLDAFLLVMEEQGLAQHVRGVIYEEDRLPYHSAYLIPLDQLPKVNYIELIDQFDGTITHVQEINYLGTEQFYTDFMIYPLSRSGYIELDGVSLITFAPNHIEQESGEIHMVYVINLEDGSGEEYFITLGGGLVGLSSRGIEQPQEFKTYQLTAKRIAQLKPNYPPICRLYAVERREFDKRRQTIWDAVGKTTVNDENQLE
jgi:hypothetical protein